MTMMEMDARWNGRIEWRDGKSEQMPDRMLEQTARETIRMDARKDTR